MNPFEERKTEDGGRSLRKERQRKENDDTDAAM